MKNIDLDINTVADFFLSKSNLTPKKIQKLVYYAYAWFIALNNQSSDDIRFVLFNEEPEAWIHGPVFPSLYYKYRDYGFNEITKLSDAKSITNKDLVAFLNDIWDTFGNYSADELEYMTHQEEPWKNARVGISPIEPSNNSISKRDIFNFYNKLANNET